MTHTTPAGKKRSGANSVPPSGSVTVQDGFCWDRQDAYLFDIDGTLLRSRDRFTITPSPIV